MIEIESRELGFGYVDDDAHMIDLKLVLIASDIV